MPRQKEQFIGQRFDTDQWIDECGPYGSTAEALKGIRKGGTPGVPYRVVAIKSATFKVQVETREFRKLAQEAK